MPADCANKSAKINRNIGIFLQKIQDPDFSYFCLTRDYSLVLLNRIGETGLVPVSSFHTTVRTVRYTAVP